MHNVWPSIDAGRYLRRKLCHLVVAEIHLNGIMRLRNFRLIRLNRSLDSVDEEFFGLSAAASLIPNKVRIRHVR